MKNRVSGIREKSGLRPVINASGTMTALGASIVVPQAIEAVAAILPEFVEMNDLQRKASEVITRLTKTEAGFMTASCAAGISLAVAGAMTGVDPARVEQLPDTTGMKNEVLIQMGHMVFYGASVPQAARLTGAKVIPVGDATRAEAYQLAGKITENTAAALYVVSHHTVEYGLIPLKKFAEVCHEKGVPVIVDAASEYDLEGFYRDGADVVLYSGHKFLGGPTAGIVAGRKALVRASFFQNSGIGRGMKIGKESIYGAMAALEAWEKRDHAGIRAREKSYLALWLEKFANLPGVNVREIPDPTNNPLDRLRFTVNPEQAGLTACELADRLAKGSPPIIIRDHCIEHGYFDMDPCNMHPGEAEIVAERVMAEVGAAHEAHRKSPRNSFPTLAEHREGWLERYLAWPD